MLKVQHPVNAYANLLYYSNLFFKVLKEIPIEFFLYFIQYTQHAC